MRTPLITLEIPDATPSNNVIKGMHYRVYQKLRQHWRQMTAQALQLSGAASDPLEKSYIEIDRHCAGGGLDWDNAYGGLKPLLDCLVVASARNPDGLGVIVDDSPKHMPMAPLVTQHTAKKGASRTVVRIYAA